MQNLKQMINNLLVDESGQDLIEYVLGAALLALSAIAGLKSLAGDVTALWQGLASALSTVL